MKEHILQEHNHFKTQVKTDCDSVNRHSKLLLMKHENVESKSDPFSIDSAW